MASHKNKEPEIVYFIKTTRYGNEVWKGPYAGKRPVNPERGEELVPYHLTRIINNQK